MKVGEVGSVLAVGTCSVTQQGGGTLGDIVTVWAPAVAPSQLCTVGEHSLNPGAPRCHLSPAHLSLSTPWGLPQLPSEAAGGSLRTSLPLQSHIGPHPGHYLHCHMLQHSYFPGIGAVPRIHQQLPVPSACPGQHPGQGQGVGLCVGVPGMAAPACAGWFMRDGKASGLQSPSQSCQGIGGAGEEQVR